MRTSITAVIVATALLVVSGALKAENWPQFRGPSGQGVSSEKGLSLKWNATENVAWKTPIPGESWSSPIVWVRVFVSPDKGEHLDWVLVLDDAVKGSPAPGSRRSAPRCGCDGEV